MTIVERVIRDHKRGACTVATSPDGRYAFSGGWDKILRKHNLSTGREVCASMNDAHTAKVWMARCAPDGETIVTCDHKNEIFLKCGMRRTSS